MSTQTAVTPEVLPEPSIPLLARLALQYLLREVRKHPHTVAARALREIVLASGAGAMRGVQWPEVAREGFGAYNDAIEPRWQTHDGRPVPQWEELGDKVRARWTAAAERIVSAALKLG
ncbi:hypothetical protein [Hyalangium gracile]|uniref:hypothetical protein n=1 Tax=Hyalangium gracile TaxID=394092 RepID=UPI001CCCB2A0|nr:hypothetical protein [Hyalangium gracile]